MAHLSPFHVKNCQVPAESPHGTRSICSKPGEKKGWQWGGTAQALTDIDMDQWIPMDCLIDVKLGVAQVIFAKISEDLRSLSALSAP